MLPENNVLPFMKTRQVFAVPEVAKILGVCERTVRREIASGKLGSIRIGQCVRVRQDQLDSYMNQDEH